MKQTGQVKYITGVVTAVNEDGAKRILQIGDNVTASELVETSAAGSISIEFPEGAIFDLGRNASSSFEIESESPFLDQEQDDTEAVEAMQQALLDENFDPTDPSAGLEAPAAGPEVTIALDDDGSTVVHTEYAEPRRTPDSGFETEPIAVEFPELPPLELIQDPILAAAGTGGGVPIVDVVDPIPPVVDIYTINEQGRNAAEIQAGQSKFFGISADPTGNDSVTQIIINGFPEDGVDPNTADWTILPLVFDNTPNADYQVDFNSYTPSASGWQLTLDVTGADPGEEIEFLLNISAPSGIPPQSVPLDISYANTANVVSPPAPVAIDVEQPVFP